MEKKARVLLVEDDEDQIKWACQQIGELCNLTIARNVQESESLKEKGWDMVLSDLELPARFDSLPNFQSGRRHFEGYLEMLEGGKIKGLGLLSNFEHHISFLSSDEKAEIMEWREELPESAVGFYRQEETLVPETFEEGIEALAIFCDKPLDFTHFFIVEEKRAVGVKEAIEIGKSLPKGERGWNPLILIVKEGVAKPLKPYKEVFEYLSTL